MKTYKDSNKTLVGIGTDKQTEVTKKCVAESKSKRLSFDSSPLSLLIFFHQRFILFSTKSSFQLAALKLYCNSVLIKGCADCYILF